MNQEMKFTQLSMQRMFRLKEHYRVLVDDLNKESAQKEIHRLEEVAEYQRKLDLAMAVIENLRLTAENCGKLTEEMTDMIDGVKNEI